MHDVEARDARIPTSSNWRSSWEELQAKRQRIVAVEKNTQRARADAALVEEQILLLRSELVHAGGDVRPRSIRWEWGRVDAEHSAGAGTPGDANSRARGIQGATRKVSARRRDCQGRDSLSRLLAKEAMDKVGVKDEEAARARDEVERARMELRALVRRHCVPIHRQSRSGTISHRLRGTSTLRRLDGSRSSEANGERSK